jgi:hypothetical protein
MKIAEEIYPSKSAKAYYNKEKSIYEIIVKDNYINIRGENCQFFFRFAASLLNHQIVLKLVEFSFWNDEFKQELASYKNIGYNKFWYQSPKDYYTGNGYKPNYINIREALKLVTDEIYKMACDAFLETIKNNFKLAKR